MALPYLKDWGHSSSAAMSRSQYSGFQTKRDKSEIPSQRRGAMQLQAKRYKRLCVIAGLAAFVVSGMLIASLMSWYYSSTNLGAASVTGAV